ncbi:helix-turn-helix domain-containing protein [Candidatus Planktophila dulcis]|uniref:helix-turn-helix domain-containing protein n=1 Tax=Candidatus Planktophila dulcis TaxID=1884914 RepID=UPI003CF058E8
MMATKVSVDGGSSTRFALRMDQALLVNLTPRQRQILACLVDGKSSKDISALLGIAPNTVRREESVIHDEHIKLFGPSALESLIREKLSEVEYELPQDSVELASTLKNSLAKSTNSVSTAVTLAVQEFVNAKLNTWFADSAITSDKGLMKKLANTVSTPGASGEQRTLEALSSIPRWESLFSSLTREDAARILRDETNDFRKAKSYLANQAKCINAFPKFFLEEDHKLEKDEKVILEGKVESGSELRAWSATLGAAWVRTGGIKEAKNHKLYQSYWNNFINVVITRGIDSYTTELIAEVDRFLSREDQKENFYQNLGLATTANRNIVNPKPILHSTLKVDGTQIAIYVEVKAASAKILQMKDDLVFLCAQDSLLQRLSIEVSLPDSSLPQLVVRFSSPKELTSYRRAIDSINSNIKRAYDEI